MGDILTLWLMDCKAQLLCSVRSPMYTCFHNFFKEDKELEAALDTSMIKPFKGLIDFTQIDYRHFI